MKVLVMGAAGMLGEKVFQVLKGKSDICATLRDPYGLRMRHPAWLAIDSRHTLCGMEAGKVLLG